MIIFIVTSINSYINSINYEFTLSVLCVYTILILS